MLFECKLLAGLRAKHGLVRFKRASRGKKGDLLWKYLGGDQCGRQALLLRGRRLYDFFIDYKEEIYKLLSVKLLMT